MNGGSVLQKDIFDYYLATYCAPTLFGIKPANLFSCKKSVWKENALYFCNSYQTLRENGIVLKVLCSCNQRILILVYREDLLKQTLSIPENEEFLLTKGYDKGICLKEALVLLQRRVKENRSFPHEIGVFLGYPLSDICGFIANNGKNFKMNGYWKVYGDVNYAIKLFYLYEMCRKTLCFRVSNGMSISEFLKNAI